jgi:hypothetical protein
MKTESLTDDERYDDAEADRRRDLVTLRLMQTKPQPHPKPQPGRKPGRPIRSIS